MSNDRVLYHLQFLADGCTVMSELGLLFVTLGVGMVCIAAITIAGLIVFYLAQRDSKVRGKGMREIL